MHIKSLVIDGFKSYGKRVELNNFDPEFNAITGSNGTGKSNIVDAICFTLGISAMKTIRASTMQDLIYKNGQAGVHTATVTIHFDNRDKSRSPPYYEHYDEIVISREVGMGFKNTYRINRVAVSTKRVMDFFNSLQMNINNPHFIIIQGRITKVLNMKPIEILSMIEEAAGTNMYETKKKNLEMTIDKNSSKLRTMQDRVDKEIVPTLETIEKEKEMVNELIMVHDQLKKEKEKLDIWDYVQLNISVKEKSLGLQSLKDKQLDISNSITFTEEQIKQIKQRLTKKVDILKTVREKQLIEFKNEVNKTMKFKKEVEFKVNTHKYNINSKVIQIKDVENQIKVSKKNLEAKKKELKNFNEMYIGIVEETEKNTKDLDEINKKIRKLNSGNIFGDDDGLVLNNTNKLNLDLQNQQIENQQSAIKIDRFKRKLNEHLTGLKEAQKVYDKQIAQLTAKEREYERVKNEYLKTNEELRNHDNLKSNRDSLLKEICNFSSSLELFESNNSNLFFKYNDPRPNFDRLKVHGLICRLFKPIDFKFELALTTLAGGKLYFIVVEDDTVGKDILETNKFPNRMNFIPLSKIKSESLPQHTVRLAQEIGGADQVFPAISLISYDIKHLKAIQWVFGKSFICTTKEVAEKVCFDHRINKHCFTLDGDHFNPAGSLTGGANAQRLILNLIASQNKITSQLEAKKSEFSVIDNKLAAFANLSEEIAQLRDRQITVLEELEKIKFDLHLGQPHQQITEINSMKQQIVELEKNLTEGELNEKQLLTKIKDLETKMKNFKSILKQQLSDAEKTRKIIFTTMKNNKTEYDKKKNTFNKLELEINDLISQIQEEENQLAEYNAEKVKLDEDLIICMSELNEATIIYEKANKEYTNQHETYIKETDDIEKLNESIKVLQTETMSKRIELSQIDVDMNKSLQMFEDAQNRFHALDKRISNEQKQMALAMDFTNFNSDECKQSINDLQVRYDQLSKIVDPGKLNNAHKYIQEFKKLNRKINIIVKEQNKINEIIRELDDKKRQHLQCASDRVNMEFGKIFNSLLPGAQSSLKQVNPQDITAGLEISVAFNGLWKDSLNELSGGQRSLVALSLLLAMLLFNPVPFYILDEVDAALDLSHTQNIGKMLKQHFKQSQFIIVSLKDGMFSNANVLFKTKFVDSSSAVTRTECKQT